jgi:hypothetical protein
MNYEVIFSSPLTYTKETFKLDRWFYHLIYPQTNVETLRVVPLFSNNFSAP